MAFERGHPPYPRRSRLQERAELVEQQCEVAAEATMALLEISPPRRWSQSISEPLDPWFLEKLNERWPGFSEQTWRGKLASFAGSNEFLFVTNDEAVLLMVVIRHPMDGKPVVLEVFGWAKRDERALAALRRYGSDWAKDMHAVTL